MQPDATVSIPSFDRAAIAAHVKMLHELATGVDGVLVVSVFNEGRPGIVTHHNVGDTGSMVDAIVAHDSVPGANVYTGLQIMRRGLPRGTRGLEKDIVAVLGLVADIDADTGKTGTMPATPSYIVESSPGNFQPVWLFDAPAAPTDAKSIAAALRAATGADHGTADVTHVWRIPGTLSWPNRKKLDRGRSPNPATVWVSMPWTGTLYTPSALSSALPAAIAPPVQDVLIWANCQIPHLAKCRPCRRADLHVPSTGPGEVRRLSCAERAPRGKQRLGPVAESAGRL